MIVRVCDYRIRTWFNLETIKNAFMVRVWDIKRVFPDSRPCINKCFDNNAVVLVMWHSGEERFAMEICRDCLKKLADTPVKDMLKQHKVEILVKCGFHIDDSFFENPEEKMYGRVNNI